MRKLSVLDFGIEESFTYALNNESSNDNAYTSKKVFAQAMPVTSRRHGNSVVSTAISTISTTINVSDKQIADESNSEMFVDSIESTDDNKIM